MFVLTMRSMLLRLPAAGLHWCRGPGAPSARSSVRTVDLRSDTVTKPTSAMRAAMASASVGDDVYGEDPTVNELQNRAAELFGMEAALFVPSGTMGNLISDVPSKAFSLVASQLGMATALPKTTRNCREL